MPTALELKETLEEKLSSCLAQSVQIDSITFSGDGEPTLNPEFPEIIDITLELRDKYYPQTKVSVLSNATKLGRPAVFNALKKVDNPILKLDAPDDRLARIINIPAGDYSVEETLQYMMKFNGDFILQTMFLKSKDFDSSEPYVLNAWMDIVRKLKPREIMVYTIDRETPMAGLEKFTEEQMRQMVEPLIEEGFRIQIRG